MASAMVTSIRLYLTLLWLKICRWVVHALYDRSLKPTDQFFHKIVVIGDDFAAGVGDYLVLGGNAGLAQHLPHAIAQSDKVRHRWAVVNRGVVGSTTGDWLLNAPTKYMDDILSSKATRDAEVVIVVLGSQEYRCVQCAFTHSLALGSLTRLSAWTGTDPSHRVRSE
ncbi:hypothetical protein PINS_up000159 [Pythium insidiosum]|nr:hypothetical protein PINS_up000159 [Pythium insidiosum]